MSVASMKLARSTPLVRTALVHLHALAMMDIRGWEMFVLVSQNCIALLPLSWIHACLTQTKLSCATWSLYTQFSRECEWACVYMCVNLVIAAYMSNVRYKRVDFSLWEIVCTYLHNRRIFYSNGQKVRAGWNQLCERIAYSLQGLGPLRQ